MTTHVRPNTGRSGTVGVASTPSSIPSSGQPGFSLLAEEDIIFPFSKDTGNKRPLTHSLLLSLCSQISFDATLQAMPLTFLLLLLTACSSQPAKPPALLLETVQVLRIVDGDTISIEEADGDTEHVRIIGIDTPEKGECYFDEASEHLRQLIGNRRVELKSQPTDNRDKYQRLLRYVHLADKDVGRIMLQDGYARIFPWFDHPRMEEYKAVEFEAKQEGRGLWGAC